MIRMITLSVLLIAIGVGSAEAYCRGNTLQCKQVRLEEKEAELQKKIAVAPDDYSKIQMKEEIESILFEANRIEEKLQKTALK